MLRGTEKQIAWAKDIEDRLFYYITMSDENAEKDLPAATAAQIAEHRSCLKVIRRAIESIDYAGDVIQNFRDVPRCKDNYKSGIDQIISVFRVCPEMAKLIKKTAEEMEEI